MQHIALLKYPIPELLKFLVPRTAIYIVEYFQEKKVPVKHGF